MAFQVHRDGADQPAGGVGEGQVLRGPAGACGGGAALLQQIEKSVGYGRVDFARAGVPLRRRDVGYPPVDVERDRVAVAHRAPAHSISTVASTSTATPAGNEL